MERSYLVLGWRDKGKTVIMLTTVHTATLTTVTGRRGEMKTKYLLFTSTIRACGVDKVDQYAVYYSFGNIVSSGGGTSCSGCLRLPLSTCTFCTK